MRHGLIDLTSYKDFFFKYKMVVQNYIYMEYKITFEQLYKMQIGNVKYRSISCEWALMEGLLCQK